MEKTSQIFTNKTQETFHQAFAKIFPFLDFASLMTSLTVSQDFYLLLNKYFKRFLMTNFKVNDFEGDEDYYRRLFRSLFAREVLIAPLSASAQSYKDLNLTRHTNYLTCGVKDFSMGPKFTVFHLYNNDLVFMNNQEYLETRFNMDNVDPKNIRKNVMKFSTAANDLFYLAASGQLHVIFTSNGVPSKEFTEGVLENTGKNGIIDFTVSYPRAILQFKDTIKCFDMTNLVPEDSNSPARLRDIEGLENQTVVSFCAGFSQAYFLTNEGKVFECNFNVMQNDKYKVTPFEHFKNSTIRKLWCGKGSFFALEQNERLSIDNWTQKEILEWVQQNKDFDDYTKIIKSECVTGKDLIRADRAFLIDRLGLDKQDLQTKFLNEIEKVSQKTYATPKLYGWGSNSSGQLGLNMAQTNVSSPMEIKTLPVLGKSDYIEHIECGTKATAIVTHSGKVWITEIPSRDNNNKDKAALRWLDLTPNCQSVRGKRQNQVVKVSLNKDYIAVLVANAGQKKTTRKAESDEQPVSTKLKGADHICNRLLWDKSLNKDEYVVGYEDRFLGVLEIPFNDFCTKSDIPSHRIKFFKRKGEIVWDRVAKKNSIGL